MEALILADVEALALAEVEALVLADVEALSDKNFFSAFASDSPSTWVYP